MDKRNNLLHYIKTSCRKSLAESEFAGDIAFSAEDKNEETAIRKGLEEIYILIRSWSEGMDLASADTKKPTYYTQIFELLFEDSRNMTYKQIADKIGGANVKKYVRKCNKIAIAKALKMLKDNSIYKKILDKYYKWEIH